MKFVRHVSSWEVIFACAHLAWDQAPREIAERGLGFLSEPDLRLALTCPPTRLSLWKMRDCSYNCFLAWDQAPVRARWFLSEPDLRLTVFILRRFVDIMVCTGCCGTLDFIVTHLYKTVSKRRKKSTTGMDAQPPCLRILESHPEMIQQVSACWNLLIYFVVVILCAGSCCWWWFFLFFVTL